jgi:hypothetical protein
LAFSLQLGLLSSLVQSSELAEIPICTKNGLIAQKPNKLEKYN